jgi:hypothetical protein
MMIVGQSHAWPLSQKRAIGVLPVESSTIPWSPIDSMLLGLPIAGSNAWDGGSTTQIRMTEGRFKRLTKISSLAQR